MTEEDRILGLSTEQAEAELASLVELGQGAPRLEVE